MFEIFQFQEKEYFIQENHTKADSTSVVRSVLYKTSVRVFSLFFFLLFSPLLYLVFFSFSGCQKTDHSLLRAETDFVVISFTLWSANAVSVTD